MRDDLIADLKALGPTVLGTFAVTEALPWSQDNQPLYVMNPKKIYVDLDQTDIDPIIDTLDGQGFATEVRTVRVYFAADAKLLPTNHESLVQTIADLRLDYSTEGWRQRRSTVTREFISDLVATTIEFVFQRTVTN